VQWFRNLIACLGDKVKIRVASKNGHAVASILTLTHQKALTYKYGCSDQRFNNLGGTQLLFWKAIEEAKQSNFQEFDLGRSDTGNSGLVTFKDRWGAARTTLVYFRCSLRNSQKVARAWQTNLAKHFFAHIPDPFLAAAGRLLYKHIG
jgi:lipid II:glycine glycyltransferase (peptidoglycan interpeptide bridge formation enzyme)